MCFRNAVRSLIVAMGVSTAAMATTVSFQNGTEGYQSAVDLLINDDVQNLSQKGADVQNYFIDGDQSDRSEVNFWSLIRFDNIFGADPGQIPPGATILSARLELSTSGVSNAQSGGPFGVARLLKPFDETSNWSTAFGGDGILCNGFPDESELDRAAGGYRALTVNTTSSAPITSIVQAWSNGEPNYGMVVIAGTSDAWSTQTTGNTTATAHPKLIVDYVDTPSKAITFQEDVNGYTGTSMTFLRMDGTTALGESYVREYLDLRGAAPDTTNTVHALLKFEDVFGEGGTQVPSNTDILRAFLVVTTAPRSESYETRSNGPFNIRPLLADFNWTLTDGAPGLRYWNDFGPNGPTQDSGTVGPILASAVGMIWDSQAWFDITDQVKAWQTGQTNYGLLLESASSDGWKINWLKTGAIPPKLVVLIPHNVPDLNGDSYVDWNDVQFFAACASGDAIPVLPECVRADFDNDQDVDQDDFGILQNCFNGLTVAPAGCR